MCLYVATLFFVLTPGVLVSLPSHGSKMVVAATHAVVFTVIYGLSYKTVSDMMYREGFKGCPKGTKLSDTGDCEEKK